MAVRSRIRSALCLACSDMPAVSLGGTYQAGKLPADDSFMVSTKELIRRCDAAHLDSRFWSIPVDLPSSYHSKAERGVAHKAYAALGQPVICLRSSFPHNQCFTLALANRVC